jgi:subtilisin-like proprotein convertase family protein
LFCACVLVFGAASVSLAQSGTGACCVDGQCVNTNQADCDALGGIYLGDGTDCDAGAGPPIVYEADPALPIPDAFAPGVSYTIVVPDSFTLTDVDVDVNIEHTYINDLIIKIEHLGTTVILWDRACDGDYDDLQAVFDDEGSVVTCSSPTVGDITPASAGGDLLAAFDGNDAAGDWTITVSDNFQEDTGVLLHVSVHLGWAVDPCPKPPPEHLKWSQPPIETDPNLTDPVYCGWDERSYFVSPRPCELIEDFEDGNLAQYTVPGGSPNVIEAAAHDGLFGLDGDPAWIYRNDSQVHVKQGNIISFWVKVLTDGRAYCGFGASAVGTYLIGAAPNTGELILQMVDNNYGMHNDLAAVAQTWTFDKWYRLEAEWHLGGDIIGRLYDSDGITLLNTVTANDSTYTSGGIAFRAFANHYFDTVKRCSPQDATAAAQIASLSSLPSVPEGAAYIAGTWSDGSVHYLDSDLNDLASFSSGSTRPNGTATNGALIWTGHHTSSEVIAYDIQGNEQFRWNASLAALSGMEYISTSELAIANTQSGQQVEFYDPFAGSLLRTVPAQPSVEALAWDGRWLWQLDDSNICATDINTGNVSYKISNPALGEPNNGTGITAGRAGQLTVAAGSGNWWKIDSNTGAVLASGNNGLDMYALKAVRKPEASGYMAADDFRCLGSMPVTSVHWWGSHIGWDQPVPPAERPTAWNISFWSNVPAPNDPCADPNYSYPGTLLWQIKLPADRVQLEWAGQDQYPTLSTDACFQYYTQLEPDEYFWQDSYTNSTEDNVFWMSIAALYAQGVTPEHPWGFKTRPWSWMDSAVSFAVYGRPWVAMELDPCDLEPIKDPCYSQSFDLAFELDTDPNYIKWEQAYTGVRHWPHYEDESSVAVEDNDSLVTVIRQVADDWLCETNSPVTAVAWWGSYIGYEYQPCQGPPNAPPRPAYFLLTIWDDVPAGADPCHPFSHPNEVLWHYKAQEYDEVLVGYDKHPELSAEPPREPVFRYSVRLPPQARFVQEQPGTVYWLGIVAVYAETIPTIPWGWTNHKHTYNDNAVSGVFDPPGGWFWDELFDQTDQSEDMSFVLFTDPNSDPNAGTCWDPAECAGQPSGDATCDGNVNLADLFALKAHFGNCAPWTDPECCTDFTQDGCVNLGDLFSLKAGFGTNGYAPSTGNQSCP